MKILKEIINPNTVNLTNIQQGVLIDIKISPTPELAYETTNGSDQSVYARNTLRVLGLIKVGDNRAGLTDSGNMVISNFNLIDNSGNLTERGKTVYNNYKTQTKTEANPTDNSDGNMSDMDMNS